MEINLSGAAFCWGALIGLICIGGLGIGFKILIQGIQNTGSHKLKRKMTLLIAVGVLISQLGLSMFLLFKTPWVRASPLCLGLGMILSILLTGTLMNYWSGSK